jgi:TonB family protein
MNVRYMTTFAFALAACSLLRAQDRTAYIEPGEGPSSAIDVKGRRYSSSDYSGAAIPPWWQDRVRAVAPEYPIADRARHHEGAGLFKASLDLKTGFVTAVTVTKSTGFRTLDGCAIAALQKWRWTPGRWRVIEVPVRFTMSRPSPPRGSVRLPNS